MRAITFEHVSKIYPGNARPAVDDCSLVVEAGEFVVFLGPSGCGKTTLLRMVNRLIEPSSGRITIGDSDIRQLDVTALRRQIGYVIQQVGLFPHMTVAQNVAVVPKLLGWSKEKISARVDELLELIALPPSQYRGRYPAQLSGGQQQRVGLARALAADPDVMLMDEPFGAIDAIARTTLQNEMLRLRGMLAKTILFVTHDVEEALRLADRIVVMREGRIVQYDTPFSVLTNPAHQFVYELMGSDDITRHLGLLPVSSAMSKPQSEFHFHPQGHSDRVPVIGLQDNLRSALSLILRSGAPALTVVDEGRPVGTITLENIRGSTHGGEKQ